MLQGIVNLWGSQFHNLIAWCSIRLISLSILLTIAYGFGYIHRFLWFLAERECTKLVNGVPVSFGGVASVDLFRGKFTLINGVIHSPNGKLWKSPILARIGRAQIHVNAIQCLFSLWFLGEELPIDFYSVRLSDIQVFVERKANVYNFFLLDPNIILPPAFVELNTTAATTNTTTSVSSTPTSAPTNSSPKQESSKETEETAAALVDDMLDAVKRAAAEGSADGLVSHYRDRLHQSLRTFETTKMTDALIQTVDLIQNVGMNITHKTALAQQVVVPTRRPNPHIVYGRVGTLEVHSLRIFLQDTPIFVPKFCPNTEFTNAFLPMDELMDTLVKRLVAVVAKSNSSQFLQTAMQEMADALTER